MGLFDDFDIDMDEVKAATGIQEFEDGHYDFDISEALVQQGSKNNPDNTYFIIKYDLNDGEVGTYWEWYTVAVDGNPEHANAKRSLGYLKARFTDLGFQASELNTIEAEDLEGIRGTLELKSTAGKGKNAGTMYQNVRNVKVGGSVPSADEVSDQPSDYDDGSPEQLAATKKRVAAKRAASEEEAEKPAPSKRPARRTAPADDDDQDNPFA